MKALRLLIVFLAFQAISFAYIGKISAMSREVYIIRDTKSVKASAGNTLEQKDTIKTSKGGVAQIVFSDNTVITVGENSTFSIEEYVSDEKNPNARFKADKGYFKVATGQIGKIAPDKFKIETKTATIGIRGTEFRGFVDEYGNLTTLTTKGRTIVVSTIPNVAVASTEVPAGYKTKATQKGVEVSTPFSTDELKNMNTGLGRYAANGQKQEDNDKAMVVTADTPVNVRDMPSKITEQNLNDKLLLAANKIENDRLEAIRVAEALKAAQLAAQATSAVQAGSGSVSSAVSAVITASAAAGYSANYVPGVTYNAATGLRAATRQSIVGTGQFTGSDALYTADSLNLDIQNNSFTETLSGMSLTPTPTTTMSFSGEDSFSITKTGNYAGDPASVLSLSTTTDSNGLDYVSWGYWSKVYNGFKDNGTWISGIKTITMPNTGTSVSYSGSVIGYAGLNGATASQIVTGDGVNSATFNIADFASPAISGTIKFNDAAGTLWMVTFNPKTFTGNTFSVSGADGLLTVATHGGAALQNSANTVIYGAFYGPSANVIGGNFGFLRGDNTGRADGVFKAVKQ